MRPVQLLAQRFQVGRLGACHWFITGHPIVWILFRIGEGGRINLRILDCHRFGPKLL